MPAGKVLTEVREVDHQKVVEKVGKGLAALAKKAPKVAAAIMKNKRKK